MAPKRSKLPRNPRVLSTAVLAFTLIAVPAPALIAALAVPALGSSSHPRPVLPIPSVHAEAMPAANGKTLLVKTLTIEDIAGEQLTVTCDRCRRLAGPPVQASRPTPSSKYYRNVDWLLDRNHGIRVEVTRGRDLGRYVELARSRHAGVRLVFARAGCLRRPRRPTRCPKGTHTVPTETTVPVNETHELTTTTVTTTVASSGSCPASGLSQSPSGKILHTSAALIPGDGASGYVLDGYGGLHAFCHAPAVTSSATWPGWDIARAVAALAAGKGYVMDGWGGIHPFGGAPPFSGGPYWAGWDIARGFVLCPGGEGGYVLDGYGGLHPVGNAKPLSGGPYWGGWDIARGLVLNSTCTGGYVLDGWGGVHPFGDAPAVDTTAYWPNWDIAKSITLLTDSSGYVLDGWGGIHPFAAGGTTLPPTLSGTSYQPGNDVYRALVVDPLSGTGVEVPAYGDQGGGSLTGGQVGFLSGG